jgi:hypothetical protein
MRVLAQPLRRRVRGGRHVTARARGKADPRELASVLALSPSESTPLWLELARRQAQGRKPRDLLGQFERDGYVAPFMLDQRTVHRLDGLALEAAAEFEAVQLSPVAPLGSCSVLAPTSQHRTLSAARATEVVSDPTNVLALECARRLKASAAASVRLCTVHQVLRAQPLPKGADISRHFRLFALAEAGPGEAEDGFEVAAIARQVQLFDRLFDALAQLGCAFPERNVALYAAERRRTLAARVRARLQAVLPHVAIVEHAFESRYYDGLRLLFGARAASGETLQIADIGVFDWAARLTSNRRMRFVASGFGLQRAVLAFKRG